MKWNISEIECIPSLMRCFHAAAICQSKVYMHGGLKEYPCNDIPFNDVIVFDPTTKKIQVISSKNAGPSRSHHTAVALNDRYICIVGGWDGKKRTSEVWLFDTLEGSWNLCKPRSCSNPPSGLSSHTCTLVKENEMIITGREGGVRMQRRFASVFKLTIDVARCDIAYEEMPTHISSRSGHTSCSVPNQSKKKHGMLVIVGGRDSIEADFINLPSITNPLNNDLGLRLSELIAGKSNTISAAKPRALRHHASIPAGEFCLIHGGETFGKVRNTITCDLMIHNATATQWWQANFDVSEIMKLERMGHSICWLEGKLFILGGIQHHRNIASSVIVEIEIPSNK